MNGPRGAAGPVPGAIRILPVSPVIRTGPEGLELQVMTSIGHGSVEVPSLRENIQVDPINAPVMLGECYGSSLADHQVQEYGDCSRAASLLIP